MFNGIFQNRRITFLFFVVACGLLLGGPSCAVAQDYVVVANKDLGLTCITSADLFAVFTGKKRFWDSGEKVTFALFDGGDLQDRFLKEQVHKTPSQFKNYWTKMVFTGKGSMPEYLKTVDAVLTFVNAAPGAISFVPAPGGNNVKILTIQ